VNISIGIFHLGRLIRLDCIVHSLTVSFSLDHIISFINQLMSLWSSLVYISSRFGLYFVLPADNSYFIADNSWKCISASDCKYLSKESPSLPCGCNYVLYINNKIIYENLWWLYATILFDVNLFLFYIQ